MATHSGRKSSGKGSLMIAEQLRRAVADSGESQLALATRAGISSQQLSRFVRGERDLTLETAGKLCAALGLGLSPLRGSKN